MGSSIRIDGDVAFISLSRGAESAIDAADVSAISGRSWSLLLKTDGRKYAKATFLIDGQRRVKTLHRFLTDAKLTEMVDHRDGDGLNNRRINLRICSQQQNTHNRTISKTNKVGFKNVVFRPEWQSYQARVMLKGKRHHAGSFSNAVDAALAADKLAEALHGDFALLNFPSLTNRTIRSIYPTRPEKV